MKGKCREVARKRKEGRTSKGSQARREGAQRCAAGRILSMVQHERNETWIWRDWLACSLDDGRDRGGISTTPTTFSDKRRGAGRVRLPLNGSDPGGPQCSARRRSSKLGGGDA